VMWKSIVKFIIVETLIIITIML